MGKKRHLLDEYRVPGYRPRAKVQGIFGDSRSRVIRLERRQKKQYADSVAQSIEVITTRKCVGYGIYRAGVHVFIWRQRFVEYCAGSAGK